MGLKLNFHGLIGIFLVILMFIIAYFHNWNIDWLYFVAALVPYSIAIIYLTTGDDHDYRFLFGFHCALAFLALGLWLNFGNIAVDAAFYLAGWAAGLVIPFALVSYGSSAGFIPYGLLGVLAIIGMFAVVKYPKT